MTNSPVATAANGGRDLGLRIAVVVDTDVSRQLETRSVLRNTGLFSLIISCESSEMARDIVEADDCPKIHLLLVDLDLADDCLPHFPQTVLARTVLLHEAEDAPDTDLIALPRPLSLAVIEDIVARFGGDD